MPPLWAQSHSHFTSPNRCSQHSHFMSQHQRSSSNANGEVHAHIPGPITFTHLCGKSTLSAFTLHITISAPIFKHKWRSSYPRCGLNRIHTSRHNIDTHLPSSNTDDGGHACADIHTSCHKIDTHLPT